MRLAEVFHVDKMQLKKLQLYFLTLTAAAVHGVYVDHGYPYDTGEFMGAIDTVVFTPRLPGLEKPIMQTKAFFPTAPGDYAVFYFITGFAGVIPPFFYNETLEMIASHGYIVFGAFPLVGEDGPAFTGADHMENLKWLKENAVEDLGGAVPDFNHTALGGHSGGCGPTMDMFELDNSIAQAQVNLEPMTPAIIFQNMTFAVPALNYGAELANNSCAFTGADFETFHRKWKCPKILMEAANVGHCDFLDEWAYNSCDVLNFCDVGDPDQLEAYRLFIQGLSSAFMTAYVQGNPDQLKYVTDPELVNWPLLQLQVTEDCD